MTNMPNENNDQTQTIGPNQAAWESAVLTAAREYALATTGCTYTDGQTERRSSLDTERMKTSYGERLLREAEGLTVALLVDLIRTA